MGKNKGMTIFEVSISLMILGIVIIGILSGIYLATKLNVSTKNRITAVQIAQTRMEEEKNRSYAEIVSRGAVANSLYYGTTTVTVTLRPEGKEVRVTVAWLERNRPTTEDLVTFVRAP